MPQPPSEPKPPRHALPSQPARTIEIPEGVVLTDDEIVAVLSMANERKATGDPGFDISMVLDGEFYTLKVPKNVSIARDEIIAALTRLNHASEFGNADVLFTFVNNRLVKRGWITLKDEQARDMIQAGGREVPRQF